MAQGLLSQAKVPETTDQLRALAAKRSELREQLQQANDQRSELAAQVRNAGTDATTRAGPQKRLEALDGRIERIERDLQSADDRIASAMERGVGRDGAPEIAVPEIPPIPEIPAIPPFAGFPGVAEETGWRHYLRVSDGLPVTMATLVLLGAFMYWRISRGLKSQIAQLLAMQTGRLEEIQRSVDTMAVEVERVSEGQRFVTRVVGEKLPADSAR